MEIRRNETPAEIAGLGTVYFEPLARAGAYWRENYGRTHSQSFRFEVAGRRYWGEIIRTFDRKGQPGERTRVDVELRTDSGRHSRALPETAKPEWRAGLVRQFKRDLAAFVEADSSPEAARAKAAGMQPEPVPAGPETAATVDLQINWAGAAGIIAAALENGTGEGRRMARAELSRMAELADERNRLSQELARRESAELAAAEAEADEPDAPACDTQAARALGAQSCACNLPRSSNPFPAGTVAAESWDGGFSDELASWKANRRAEIADAYGDAAADEF